MRDFSLKKLYYSISEVSRITEVEQYVLRYWETEFDLLKPQKNRAGNRVYSNKDIHLILYIKSLLREKKYTIEGAKRVLENYSVNNEKETKVDKDDSDLKIFVSANKDEESGKKSQLRKDLLEVKETLEKILKIL
ncbi:MAG TPA: MerR family transcriptional regulator [Ignavibacteriaceae bacterium]|nr:MerR family transcriptional regulator [Ignavibacteriaceae bacterium]